MATKTTVLNGLKEGKSKMTCPQIMEEEAKSPIWEICKKGTPPTDKQR
jgi:hypothetical protein